MQATSSRTVSATYRKPRVATTANRKMAARPAKDQIISVPTTRKAVQPQASGVVSASASSTKQQSQQVVTSSMTAQSVRTKQLRMDVTSASAVAKKQAVQRPTAQEIKQTAIQKALDSASKETDTQKKDRKIHLPHFEFKHVVLALACAAAATFSIVYFVNLNAPNVPLKVAAMQTGVDASYPSYVPRDYSLSDITTENEKVILDFRNVSEGGAFALTEEKSSWDSNALLNNYVRDEYSEEYSTIREQGLTIYMDNDKAAWVNGGIIYKIEVTAGSLTKKQIKSIAVSL